MTSTPEPAGKPMIMVTGRSGHAAKAAVLAKARPAPIAKRRGVDSRVQRGVELSRFIVAEGFGFENQNINNLLSKPRLIIICLLIPRGYKEGLTSFPRFNIRRLAHAKIAVAPIRSRTSSAVTPAANRGWTCSMPNDPG